MINKQTAKNSAKSLLPATILPYLLILLFLSLLPTTVLAEEKISLNDFIKRSLANHPYASLTANDYEAKKRENAAVSGIKDINLMLQYSYGKGSQSLFFPSFSSETQAHNLNASAEKLLSQTGTRFSLGLSNTVTKDQPAFGTTPLPNIYSQSLDFTIKQPLLRNAWGKLDRHPLRIAHLANKLAKLQYDEEREDFIHALTGTYIQWKLSYRKREIASKQLEKAKKQAKITQTQYKQGAAEKNDLIQAQQNVQNKRVLWLAERQANRTLTRKIASFMTGKTILDSPKIHPKHNEIGITLLSRQNAEIKLSTESNLERLFEIKEDIEALNLDAAKNQKAPELSIFATQSWSNSTTSNASLQANPGQNSSYQLGLSFQHALGNTQAKEKENATKARLEKIRDENQNLRLNTQLQLRELYTQHSTFVQMIKESKALLELSIENARLEEKKYKQGRQNSLFFVLAAQEKALSAELGLENLYAQRAIVESQIANLTDLYITRYLNEELHD